MSYESILAGATGLYFFTREDVDKTPPCVIEPTTIESQPLPQALPQPLLQLASLRKRE